MKPTFKADLVWSLGPPPEITPSQASLDGHLLVAYAHLTQRVNDRLSFVAQLREQRFEATTTTTLLGGGRSSVSEAQSYLLPSLLANYRADDRTLLRLFYNRQAQGQDLTTIALAPLALLLACPPASPPRTDLQDSP